MLPRHLQSLALRSAVRNRILLSRENLAYPPPFRIRPRSVGFHSSSRRRDELPKSPFQTFVDVLKEELQKNRELQDNVKQLQGDVDKFQDSEAMKRARAAYERARVCIRLTSTYREKSRMLNGLLFYFS
jgi:import inner membrane translocase subunit TIM44